MDGFIKVSVLYSFFINIQFAFAYNIDVIPSSGVILERLHNVYLMSSSSWTFALNFEMDQFREDTKRLQEFTANLESNCTLPLFLMYPSFQQEMDKAKSSLKSYLKEAEGLLHFLPAKSTRRRRESFNFVGSMWKRSIGSPPDHDISDIQIQISEIKKQSNGTRHLLDKHLSLITHMEKRIEAQSQHLREITNIFFSFRLLPQACNLTNFIDEKFMYSLIVSRLDELELMVSKAKYQLVNLKAAIYSTNVGTLSPTLIEPDKMEEMFKSIEEEAPTPVTFPTIQTLQKYSLTSVRVMPTPSAIIFLISLPVFLPDSSFDAYLPHTYPVYNKDVESWLELDLKRSVLLISHDGMYFNVLPLSDYKSCIHDTMTICLNTHKVRSRTMGHCLLSIYNNSTNLCTYVLREPFVKPYIERVQGSVIFSTDSTSILNVLCPNMNLKVLEVEGHGIIRNISFCTITSDYEKIFPLPVENNGIISYSMELDIPLLNLSLSAITNSSEILTADLGATKDALLSLRNGMPLNNGEVKLSSLLAHISATKQTQHHHLTVPIALCVTITIAMVVIIICCCIRKRRRKHQYV